MVPTPMYIPNEGDLGAESFVVCEYVTQHVIESRDIIRMSYYEDSYSPTKLQVGRRLQYLHNSNRESFHVKMNLLGMY